jgi:hypothetical protein
MADSKARAEQINLLKSGCWTLLPLRVRLFTTRSQIFQNSPHRSAFWPREIWQLPDWIIQNTRGSDVPSRAKRSSRRCPYLRSSMLAFCRFSGLYNIFRCHNCQVPQHLMFIASFLFMSGDSCRLEMPSQVYKMACNSHFFYSPHHTPHLHHIRDPNIPISFHLISTSFKQNLQVSSEHLGL